MPDQNHELIESLLREVRSLSFPAFCQLIRLLLYRSGYAGVHLIEPLSGGRLLYDGLAASSHTDLTTALTLIRVKKAEGAPVSRRFVDQLRGAMARIGAEHGLLIVTGKFSRFAVEAAQAQSRSPVRLVDGQELAATMLLCGFGVKNKQEVDADFFAMLERRATQTNVKPAAPV